MVQEVQHLESIHEALRSIPSTKKRETDRDRERKREKEREQILAT
jgi:hypothetical protein